MRAEKGGLQQRNRLLGAPTAPDDNLIDLLQHLTWRSNGTRLDSTQPSPVAFYIIFRSRKVHADRCVYMILERCVLRRKVCFTG